MKTLLLLGLALSATALAQGPLTPPTLADPATGPLPPLSGGVPQPTMKTLHQVEPRTPVQSLGTTAPYTINQPGSYYLTGNITVATGSAIVIEASGVTLDLNGYSLISTLTGSSNSNAIHIPLDQNRIRISNGSIIGGTTISGGGVATAAGFANGIYSSGFLTHCRVSDVSFEGIAGTGVLLDINGVIENCSARSCSGSGLSAEIVRNSVATQCNGTAISGSSSISNCYGQSYNGAGLNSAGSISNSRAFSEKSSAINSQGTVSQCVAISNSTALNTAGIYCTGTVSDSVGSCGAQPGIFAGSAAINSKAVSLGGPGLVVGDATAGNAENCTGTSNSGNGIQAYNATNCTGKTGGVSAFGIKCFGTANSSNGSNNGGGAAVGLSAAIAIGCTYSGLLSVPAGKTFNM